MWKLASPGQRRSGRSWTIASHHQHHGNGHVTQHHVMLGLHAREIALEKEMFESICWMRMEWPESLPVCTQGESLYTAPERNCWALRQPSSEDWSVQPCLWYWRPRFSCWNLDSLSIIRFPRKHIKQYTWIFFLFWRIAFVWNLCGIKLQYAGSQETKGKSCQPEI